MNKEREWDWGNETPKEGSIIKGASYRRASLGISKDENLPVHNFVEIALAHLTCTTDVTHVFYVLHLLCQDLGCETYKENRNNFKQQCSREQMSNYIGKTEEFLVYKQMFIPSASWFWFWDVQKKISKLNTCFKNDSNIFKDSPTVFES